MPEIKYQEDEDSEVVCCSCVHNIRQQHTDGHTECRCEIDKHYIGYISCMTNYCDAWERSERLRGENNGNRV